ncbi:LPS-assembly protein LptD [Marimonas lutisalis]|uniref:LPS-assembly protein LptD n=1 Tax=Marimonas lutisalis TaxID=2545756 RepID=UPI0010F5BA05|nr:LPS assembly protein LptD [Marimonas lutisalis]
MRLSPLIAACLALALCLLPLATRAQPPDEAPDDTTAPIDETATDTGPSVLVADKVYLDGKTRLVAEGNVEALHGDARIQASRIIYDREADTLTIEGPITITQEGAEALILANGAEIDAAYRNGLLTGARMVLSQQLQLAALQLGRYNGRYSQLYKAAVTSCRVCGADTPPLWQIRARSVIHDQLERQLYFDDAQFRVLDVPIFYLPRLRLPDPTLERATGFLIPSFSGNSQLGSGIRVPYFIRLGDHRDLTIVPFLTQNSRTLELRYRQAFSNGRIEFNGAVSSDNLGTAALRSYVYGKGHFNLRNDFKLDFDLQVVSDKTYLFDYGYSDNDTMASELRLSRTRRDEALLASLAHYHSLRLGEDASTIPSLIGDFSYEARHFPRLTGGELRLGAALHSHFRYSDTDIDGPDADTIVDGRDVTRLNATALWRRDWTLAMGLRTGIQAGVAFDQFYTADDAARPSQATQVTPMAAVSLRWPMQKVTRNGALHVIEPMVQLGWTGGSHLDVANDESTRVEFDEGNLLSLSRFPAPDRRERGLVAAYGLHWTRMGPQGWTSRLTLGQITRETADPNFSTSSGLRGTTSALLVAGQVMSTNGLSLTARALFDSNLNLSKGEARGTWQTPRLAVGASYGWLGFDPLENRPATISEWSVDGLYRISRHWSGNANMRYDVVSNKAAEAAVGLQYRNECVTVDLSVSRRFTSSAILEPSTDFSFTIGINGFSAETQDKSYTRTCRN